MMTSHDVTVHDNITMYMMTSQVFEVCGSSEKQKFKYLEDETEYFFQLKKCIIH